MTPHVILLTPLTGEALARVIRVFDGRASVLVANGLVDVERAVEMHPDATLLAFGTGVIVPRTLLQRFRKPAYNVHAASPEFPGRDPHHHAVYRGANRYGATLHIMAEKVDAGTIVGVEMFDLEGEESPSHLLAAANEAAFRLVQQFGRALLEETPPPALPDVKWGALKSSRADLMALSCISPLIDKDEFERRFRALESPVVSNLKTHIHGRVFRVDKSDAPINADASPFLDFTEEGFRRLLNLLKRHGYQFARYGETPGDRHVLWRHDVDFSMHRAAALAHIERAEGATATYFVNPRCSFYNLLEPEIRDMVREIHSLGHDIGLHFDASAFGISEWSLETLEPAVDDERRVLEIVLGIPISSVSWHNPDLGNLLEFGDETVSELSNAYSFRLRREYAYCSDSNGYWRFKPMSNVIAEGHQQLHLLTHPAWWTPEPMSPSLRIDRAILGRARKVRRDYDLLLQKGGRRNVT